MWYVSTNLSHYELSILIYSLPPLSQAGLREKLAFLKKRDLEWLERMDVMAEPGPSTAASSAEIQSEGEGEEEIDPEDDFKREMHL